MDNYRSPNADVEERRVYLEDVLRAIDVFNEADVVEFVSRVEAGEFSEGGRINTAAFAIAVAETIRKRTRADNPELENSHPASDRSLTLTRKAFVDYLRKYRSLPQWGQDAVIEGIYEPEETLKQLELLERVLRE